MGRIDLIAGFEPLDMNLDRKATETAITLYVEFKVILNERLA